MLASLLGEGAGILEPASTRAEDDAFDNSAAPNGTATPRLRGKSVLEHHNSDSEEQQDDVEVDLRRAPGHGIMRRLALRLWEKAPRLPCAVANGALVVLPGGLTQTGSKDALFFVGGSTDQEVLDGVWLLDDAGRRWRQVSSLPQACTELTATWHQGALWVIGGFDGFQ